MGYLTEAEFVNFLKTVRVKLTKQGAVALRDNFRDEKNSKGQPEQGDLKIVGQIEGEETIRSMTSFERIFKAAGFAHTYYGKMELKGEDGEKFYPIAGFILYPMWWVQSTL